MSAVTQIVLGAAACLLSSFAGGYLKQAADGSDLWRLALSLGLYSLASLLIYVCYRSGAESFVLLTFGSLLGTLLFTQLISSFWLNEPLNFRVLAVLVSAIIGFSWAVISSPEASNPQSTQTIQSEEESGRV